jgi:hypothetical protein
MRQTILRRHRRGVVSGALRVTAAPQSRQRLGTPLCAHRTTVHLSARGFSARPLATQHCADGSTALFGDVANISLGQGGGIVCGRFGLAEDLLVTAIYHCMGGRRAIPGLDAARLEQDGLAPIPVHDDEKARSLKSQASAGASSKRMRATIRWQRRRLPWTRSARSVGTRSGNTTSPQSPSRINNSGVSRETARRGRPCHQLGQRINHGLPKRLRFGFVS